MTTQTSLIGFSSALATASRFSRTGASMCTYGRGFRTDGELLHVRVGRVEQAAALRNRHDGDRVGQAVGDEVRAFDRIDRDVDLAAAASDFFADVEHRRFVALALADNDAPGDLHLAERLAHLFDGGAVGGVAFAAPHPARSGQRRAFGHFHEVERMGRVVQHRARNRACHPGLATREAAHFLLKTFAPCPQIPISLSPPQASRSRSSRRSARCGLAVARCGRAGGADPWVLRVVCGRSCRATTPPSSQVGLCRVHGRRRRGRACALGRPTRATSHTAPASRSCARCSYDALTWVPFLLLWLTFVSRLRS